MDIELQNGTALEGLGTLSTPPLLRSGEKAIFFFGSYPDLRANLEVTEVTHRNHAWGRGAGSALG